MTIPRIRPCLAAALAALASSSVLAGEPPAPAAAASSAPVAGHGAESAKARQEADRQRLVAKLRAEAPKTTEKPKGSVLDLPIFNRR